MSRSLPARPSLRFLKEQAKDLLKAKRKGDPAACPTLRSLRQFSRSSDAAILSARISLQEVQFALALEYGFRSWDHLTRAVAVRDHVVERIRYWDRFGPAEGFDSSTEGKAQGILADFEWMRLAEMEIALGDLSDRCARIRRQIGSLERCHESYVRNIESILRMIGAMTPGQITDCGWASDERRAEAAAYARALEVWASGGTTSRDDDQRMRQARELLGEPTPEKVRLVRHLVAKLRNNGHKVFTGEEDRASVEFHIQHMEICNFNWQANLVIVLSEIARGKRLGPGQTPELYRSHGDCPDRTVAMLPLVEEVMGWINGRPQSPGRWAQVLGEATSEKRWLAACLCKTVTAHHAGLGADKRPPSLLLS